MGCDLRGSQTTQAPPQADSSDSSLVQYSPTEDDTAGAGFEGSYAGKQDAMKGVFGLLEVIVSDFEREMKKTEEAEKEAAAAFVIYERDAKADVAAKTTKKGLDAEDLATTESTIGTKMEE